MDLGIGGRSALVLAGGVADLGQLLIDPLRQALADLLMPEFFSALTIRESQWHNGGKLRGAVLTALQQVDPVDVAAAN